MNELQQVRTLEQVAMEIRGYTSAMLTNIIEIGRRMVEAKEMLPYGEFGNWIRDNTGYSSSTANNFMRLYQEYGAAQGSLFGAEVDCQTFGKLSYSKALALLALPSAERESFVQENDVDAMSTRELQQAIAEKKAAEERALAAEKALHEMEEGEGLAVAELQAKIDELREDADKGKEALKEKAGLLDRIDQAARTEKSLKDQIRELESRPVEVAIERDEKAIEEAVEQAKAAVSAEWAEKTRKLQEDLEKVNATAEKLKTKADKASAGADEKIAAAEKETERIRQELEAARRQLKLADADVNAFMIYSKSLQQAMNEAITAFKRLADKNPQTAAKFTAPMRKILDSAIEEVSNIEEVTAAAGTEV